MPNYDKAKIYKIVDNTNGNIYIGSTTETYLSNRLSKHLSHYKSWIKHKRSRYTTSYEIFKNNDFYIELIENINCNDIYELRNRERYHIDNNECVNKNIPNRTKKEYYQDNKDKIKEYYQTNKDESKEYYQKNKDKIKEYYQTNKDKIKEYYKVYYVEKNKDKLKEKVTCECGCSINKNNILRHKKSKKHLDLMNN